MLPPDDEPGRADAVVVLSGSRIERLPKGLAVRRRAGGVLVVSGGFDPRWAQARRLCTRASRPRVVCFTPRPNSTLGEAREVARLARSRGWRRIAVISSTYHVFRSRILFRRCVDAAVAVVGARPPVRRWLIGAFTEWGKLLYQLTLERGC